MNTTGASEFLTTTTLEAAIGRHNWTGTGRGSVQVELELAVPFAFKRCPDPNHCAVYGSLSVYFSTIHSIAPPRFIWYSTVSHTEPACGAPISPPGAGHI